jgi:hypothetical protein
MADKIEFMPTAWEHLKKFEWEVFSLSQNQEFMDYLAQARERAKVEGTLSLAEVRRRLGISPKIPTEKPRFTQKMEIGF